MDIRHLKNAELEAKHQKYKGRVVLQGDIVTQAKMEDAHKLLKNSQIGVSRHLDSSTTTWLA